MNPNGLRVGTPAMTSRGLMEEDFVKIGQFIGSAVDVAVEVQKQSGPKIVDFKKVLKESPPGQLLELKQQVEDFASSFPTVDQTPPGPPPGPTRAPNGKTSEEPWHLVAPRRSQSHRAEKGATRKSHANVNVPRLLVLRQNLAPTLQLGIRMAGCNDRARFRSSSGQWSCIGQVVVMQIFMQIFLILQCYRKWGSARTPEERERYHVEGLFLALRAVDNHVLVFAVRPAVEERLGGSSCWKMKTVESRIAFSRFIFEDAEQCALQGVFLIWFESASLSDKIWIGLSTATSLSLSFTLAVQTFAEVRDWVWHRLLAVMTLNGPWILRWVMLMIMVIVYRAVHLNSENV
eukprot:s112_g28.t2